jgi:hypothetical protein
MIATRFVRLLAAIVAPLFLAASLASAQQLDLVDAAPIFQVSFEDRFVTVGNHYFAPAAIELRVGRPIRFHVANGTASSVHLHTFLILAEDGTVVGGRMQPLVAHGSNVVEWVPQVPGRYFIVCGICPEDEEMVIAVVVT